MSDNEEKLDECFLAVTEKATETMITMLYEEGFEKGFYEGIGYAESAIDEDIGESPRPSKKWVNIFSKKLAKEFTDNMMDEIRQAKKKTNKEE